MACVKTAISIEESLFKRANELAREMNVSRSKLLSLALEHFVRSRDLRELQEKINEAYAGPMDEEERAFVQFSMASLAELTKDDEW
jgi:metal-responsive CopG/Arc/MetJ family transcriptional regulator